MLHCVITSYHKEVIQSIGFSFIKSQL